MATNINKPLAAAISVHINHSTINMLQAQLHSIMDATYSWSEAPFRSGADVLNALDKATEMMVLLAAQIAQLQGHLRRNAYPAPTPEHEQGELPFAEKSAPDAI